MLIGRNAIQHRKATRNQTNIRNSTIYFTINCKPHFNLKQQHQQIRIYDHLKRTKNCLRKLGSLLFAIEDSMK